MIDYIKCGDGLECMKEIPFISNLTDVINLITWLGIGLLIGYRRGKKL